MADVVAEFHVLENLRAGQHRCPQNPHRPSPGSREYDAGPYLEPTLQGDDAMYVPPIALTASIFDVASDGVEFAAERVDVDVGEMGVSSYVGDGHGVRSAPASPLSRRLIGDVQTYTTRPSLVEVELV